jgi:hypothetical protein
MTRTQWTVRATAGAVAVLAIALTATACITRTEGADRGGGAVPRPAGTTAGPTVPPSVGAGPGAVGPTRGSRAASVAAFDRDPCAVASAIEVRAAIAAPYDLIAANALIADVPPSPAIGAEGESTAIGCGFSFVGADSDTSETYHAVVVRVTRWSRGGAALLAACQKAVRARPDRYPRVGLGDEACLGPDAVLPVRLGGRHFTVAVTLTPGRADQTDEDIRIGAVTLAAARLIVPRLPGA